MKVMQQRQLQIIPVCCLRIWLLHSSPVIPGKNNTFHWYQTLLDVLAKLMFLLGQAPYIWLSFSSVCSCNNMYYVILQFYKPRDEDSSTVASVRWGPAGIEATKLSWVRFTHPSSWEKGWNLNCLHSFREIKSEIILVSLFTRSESEI